MDDTTGRRPDSAANGSGARGVKEAPKSGPQARAVAGTIVVTLLVVLVFHRTFVTLWRTWLTSPNYSHGFLIPPVVVFLLWTQRKRFRESAGPGTAWGAAVVALALLGHIVSIRAGVFMTQGYSFVLLLFGLTALFYGRRAVGALWFPLGYLVFMLPMPPFLMNVISFRLKVFAARTGSAIAARIGIPLVRSGMTIHMPGGSLRIADPCAGLRSLIALVALGALFAWFSRGSTWKRIVLFAAAVPLAVFANILRISLLCFVANLWGVDAALGFFHDFSGLFLFVIAFLGLAIVRKLLRFETEEEPA